ncbi:MAG: hypothetical protein ACTSU5_21030 [Promethearchaeota archaeon]
MARKVVRVGYKKTHAKGQNFEVEKDRYKIHVQLVSLKTLADYDIDWHGEFYFKVKGDPIHKRRVPDIGEIKLAKNQEFIPKPAVTLWNEHLTLREGDDRTRTIKVSMRERDVAKVDKRIASQEFTIKLPQKTQYVILQDDKEQTKAKLKISASRSRF